MLMGTFQHNIDDKGRIIIPAKLRDDLDGTLVITKGFNSPCLMVFPPDEWKRFDDKLRSTPYGEMTLTKRKIYSSSESGKMDKQGRLIIPPELRKYASLECDKPSVIIGQSAYIEIWSEENWNSYIDGIDDDELNAEMKTAGF